MDKAEGIKAQPITLEALPIELLVRIFKYLSSYDHCFTILNVCKFFRNIIADHVICKEIRFFASDVPHVVREKGLDIEDYSLINTKEVLMKLPNLKVYHDRHIFTNIIHLLSECCQNLEVVSVRNLGQSSKETKCFFRNCGALRKLDVRKRLTYDHMSLISRYCARTLQHLSIYVDLFLFATENVCWPETLETLQIKIESLLCFNSSLRKYLINTRRKFEVRNNLKNLRIEIKYTALTKLDVLLGYITGRTPNLEVLSITWDTFENIGFLSTIGKLRMLQLIPSCHAEFGIDSLYFIQESAHLECIQVDYSSVNSYFIHCYLSNIKKPLDLLFRRARLNDEMLMEITTSNSELVITDVCEARHRTVKEGSFTHTNDHCEFVLKKFSDIFSI